MEQILGSTEPRLFTPAKSIMTKGPAVALFAEKVLKAPLDPWQRVAASRALELNDDGTLRFKTILIMVSRQQGKTHLLKTLCAWWLFEERVKMVLGQSHTLGLALETWNGVLADIEESPDLSVELDKVVKQQGEQEIRTVHGSRYRVAASNRRGGRGLSIDRLVKDELREERDFESWNAAAYATIARPGAQIWCASNAGGEDSVVLNSLRDQALEGTDDTLCLLEWSAEDEADPLDPNAWAQAMPNLGRRVPVNVVKSMAERAMKAGGEELAGFKTESLCQHVVSLNPAIDAASWRKCNQPGDMHKERGRVALCVDMSLNGQHATLVAAAVRSDGKVRVECVAEWSGPDAADQLRTDLPTWLKRIRPRKLAWFPNGPAAAIATDMATTPGIEIEAIRGDMAAACAGFEEQVRAGKLVHSDQELLTEQVKTAERMKRGDSWVFTRWGHGECDAIYAAAGATHVARTLPPPVGKFRLVG